jgi:hypothetical protein
LCFLREKKKVPCFLPVYNDYISVPGCRASMPRFGKDESLGIDALQLGAVYPPIHAEV